MNGSEKIDPQKDHDQTAHPSPPDTATGIPLKQGEHGDAVLQLQQQLLKIGYHDIDRSLSCDGEFGDRTRRAVEAFQHDYGLTIDGMVGCKTSNALKHAEYAHRFSESNKHRAKQN